MTTTTGGAAFDAPVNATADDILPAQGYRLRTEPGGITIRHRDTAGLRYAQQSLDQLRAASDFPAVGYDIADHPDFAVLGFLLDISRDRVPTRRTLERWLSIVALARFNQLELYCEHTFAFRDHQQVWQDASPLTADDLRWLDVRCAAPGITLVANQNTFGHMERFLRHEAYIHRAENPDGFDRGGVHRPPSTLAPPRYRLRGSAMGLPAFGSGMTSPLVVDDPGGGVTGPGGIDGPLMRGLSTGFAQSRKSSP
ncbi:glycoside hydrolase family 20 zincin-like fold domain-containing protein [Streptomyces sp. NPDC051976]|uniref:glycoside hydrolase family 20 zincin-like fold domain-containing protein n=1 Tax=Streptomyces sp. NPDC051976 TaxID=3154947 RepID=UPI00342BE24C